MTTLISIVLMNHGSFGKELQASAEMIIGKISDIHTVSLMPGMTIEEYYEMADKIVALNEGETIILTDLYGGTPCNVAMMLRQKYNVKLLCGMNLPMLIELVNSRDTNVSMEDLIAGTLHAASAGILEPPENV